MTRRTLSSRPHGRAFAAPTVVFDLDGTLADTAPDLVATLNSLLAAEGVPPLSLADARDWIGAGARALIERGLTAAGRTVAPWRLDELYAAFLEHYAAHICVATRLYPGVLGALRALDEAGFTLAVCTNKVESHAVKLIEALGIAQRFAVVAGRDSYPYCKPDPRHLIRTVAQAGGDLGRAVMVGDSRTDIVTAQAAGVPVIGVSFGYTEVPVRDLGPDRVIDHFDELFAAVDALIAPLPSVQAMTA